MAAVLAVDFSKCLFCLPYRAGVITIAVLTLLEGVGDVIYGSLVVETYQYFYSGYPSYNQHWYRTSNWYGGTSIAQGILSALLATLLLIGVFKNISNMLIPYITLMMMNALGYLIIGILMLSVELDEWMNGDEYYGIWFICWTFIICYFVSVVRTYRIMMLQQNNRGNLSNPVPHAFIPGNPAQPGQILTGYPGTGQPMGTQMPPGTYMPPVTQQPAGTHQQQGMYLPPGTYLPHGIHLPPMSVHVPGSNLPPVPQQTTGAPGIRLSPVAFQQSNSGVPVHLNNNQQSSNSVPVHLNNNQQSSYSAPVHLDNIQQSGQHPQTSGNSTPAHNPGFHRDDLRSGNDNPPPYPGNSSSPLSEKMGCV